MATTTTVEQPAPAPRATTRTATLDSLDLHLQSLGLDPVSSGGGGDDDDRICPVATQPPTYAAAIRDGADPSAAGSEEKKKAALLDEEPASDDVLVDALGHPVSSAAADADVDVRDEQLSAALAEQAMLFLRATSSRAIPSPLPRLAKPVVVPRLNPGPTVPFSRAWAPDLAAFGIAPADFALLVDALNLLSTPHAAVRVVELAAFGVGFVPWDGAEGISALLAVAAAATAHVVAHKRCGRFLTRVNDGFLHARGLHARICGSKKLWPILGVDAKTDPLVAPLGEATLGMSSQERCLLRLEEVACRLDFDGLPEQRRQTDLLARMAGWQVRAKISSAERKARWSRKRAWKRHLKGKKMRESKLEKGRIKMLDWIVLQNLDEVDKEEMERFERKKAKLGLGLPSAV